MKAALMVWILLALPAAANAGDAPARAEPRVSLDVRGETLRTALRKLATAAKTTIRVEPAVPEVPVRLTLRDVTADHALRLVVRQASRQAQGLQFEAAPEGFRVFIGASDGPPPAEANANRVTITARRSPPPSPEPEPGSASSAEGTALPELTVTGQPGAAMAGELQGTNPRGPSSPYLIEPVAPYFLRSPFGAPDYRPGILIPGLPGKKRKPEVRIWNKEHIYHRVEPLSGTRLGVMHRGPRKGRRNPDSAARAGQGSGHGSSQGPGGVGQRPF